MLILSSKLLAPLGTFNLASDWLREVPNRMWRVDDAALASSERSWHASSLGQPGSKSQRERERERERLRLWAALDGDKLDRI